MKISDLGQGAYSSPEKGNVGPYVVNERLAFFFGRNPEHIITPEAVEGS